MIVTYIPENNESLSELMMVKSINICRENNMELTIKQIVAGSLSVTSNIKIVKVAKKLRI